MQQKWRVRICLQPSAKPTRPAAPNAPPGEYRRLCPPHQVCSEKHAAHYPCSPTGQAHVAKADRHGVSENRLSGRSQFRRAIRLSADTGFSLAGELMVGSTVSRVEILF